MIRPQAQQSLWLWREVLVGALLFALGAWWFFTSFGIMVWLSVIISIVGVVISVLGYQRAKFFTGSDGPGVVEIQEGQISYLGPITGGALAYSDLTKVELISVSHKRHWRLSHTGGLAVIIPVDAQGADQLFDVFASLSGVQTSKMLSALGSNSELPIIIWSIPIHRLH